MQVVIRKSSYSFVSVSCDSVSVASEAGWASHTEPGLDPARANPLPGQTQAHALLRHTGNQMPDWVWFISDVFNSKQHDSALH